VGATGARIMVTLIHALGSMENRWDWPPYAAAAGFPWPAR
jgi:acetyl-CoA acetyltransferase